MNWNEVLKEMFTLVIYPVISLLGVYLTVLIGTQIKNLKKKTDNVTAQKYLDMLNDTIANTVLATTQTYVEALKKEGKFDAEAQKSAFKQTYDAVFKVLTEEAKKYLTESVGDLETYVTNKIEAEVKLTKTIA